MNGCCDEPGCDRDQPVRVYRGAMTGTWYAALEAHPTGDGRYVATEKHKLPPELQTQLEEHWRAYTSLAAAAARLGPGVLAEILEG